VRSVFQLLKVAEWKRILAPVIIWKFVRDVEADFASGTRTEGAEENVKGGLLEKWSADTAAGKGSLTHPEIPLSMLLIIPDLTHDILLESHSQSDAHFDFFEGSPDRRNIAPALEDVVISLGVVGTRKARPMLYTNV
jgi:hypothetical protein